MNQTPTITMLAQEAQTSPIPGALLAGGVLLVCLVIWRGLRRKLVENKRSYQVSSAEKIENIRAAAIQDSHGARSKIDCYMTDAEELTRRLAAILDNKAERAERLIDMAEKKIAELDARLHSIDGPVPALTTRSPAPITQAPDSIRYEPEDPVAVDIYRLSDSGKSPVEIAKELDEHTGKVELILALRD